MSSTTTLIIDDRTITVEAGASILHAARAAGVHIPTLCHLDGLSDVASCRLCMVEIEGAPHLHPACATPAAPGIVVHTDTPDLRAYRRTILELLFAAGNHVCAVCVANGHCELQDAAIAVGFALEHGHERASRGDHRREVYPWPPRGGKGWDGYHR